MANKMQWSRSPRGGDPIYGGDSPASLILRNRFFDQEPSPIKLYVDNAWKTGKLYHWDGTGWKAGAMRVWDGTKWSPEPTNIRWTPSQITNTVAWYSADNPANTITGGLITTLADLGPGGYHASVVATKTTGGAMTNTLNGMPVVSTTGTSGIYMAAAGGGGDALARSATAICIYTVHRLVNKGSAQYPGVASTSFGAGTATLQMSQMRGQVGNGATSFSLRTRPGSGDGSLEMIDNTAYGNNWIIAGGERHWANRTGTTWVNGTQTATGAMLAGTVAANTAMSLVIGSYTVDNVDPWSKDIAEVIYVRNGLSADDRLKLDGYLAWKWGLQANLPVDHPYKSSAP